METDTHDIPTVISTLNKGTSSGNRFETFTRGQNRFQAPTMIGGGRLNFISIETHPDPTDNFPFSLHLESFR